MGKRNKTDSFTIFAISQRMLTVCCFFLNKKNLYIENGFYFLVCKEDDFCFCLIID